MEQGYANKLTPKLPYSKPRLVVYGDLLTITRATLGTGGTQDGGAPGSTKQNVGM
jgi:hypothetical protein